MQFCTMCVVVIFDMSAVFYKIMITLNVSISMKLNMFHWNVEKLMLCLDFSLWMKQRQRAVKSNETVYEHTHTHTQSNTMSFCAAWLNSLNFMKSFWGFRQQTMSSAVWALNILAKRSFTILQWHINKTYIHTVSVYTKRTKRSKLYCMLCCAVRHVPALYLYPIQFEAY